MSRKIEDLTPETQAKYFLFKSAMADARIEYIVTCTLRTKEEQYDLYAQGRTKPGKIVTWTLNSRHLKGTAFDICLLKNGKLNWDTDDPDWQQAGKIGMDIGLIWGGSWAKNPDFPHFELNEKPG